MKILAIDIGAGTQDIMLYDTHDAMENSIKMVMPSPTRIMAKRIRNHHQDIYITGETMGGGSVNRAIKNHLDRGYKVIMEETAARTVRDDLDQVRNMGIEIVSNSQEIPHLSKIVFEDLNLSQLAKSLQVYDVELEFDYIGVAVQDHGYKIGMGDREFRFMEIEKRLSTPVRVEEFSFQGDIPSYFTRMQGIKRTLMGYNPLLMDSKFAAMAGATCDPILEENDNFIAIDVGNGHTLAATFSDGKLCGVFEHHTRMLTSNKLIKYINKLVNGKLTNNEVHNDGGHGASIVKPIDHYKTIIATGPQRKILQKTGLKIHNAAPAGDVMMAGPVGLIKSIIYKNSLKIG